MAHKQINELTTISGVLQNDDYLLVYDTSESGSEKTKKVPISTYVAAITSSLNLYVATTGSDTTGDGTSGNPWATPNKAVEWLSNKFIAGINTVVINIADGTYNGLERMNMRPTGAVSLVGNISTPANVTLNFQSGVRGFNIGNMASANFAGLKIVGGGSQEEYGIVPSNNSFVQLSSCILDNWYAGVYIYQGSFCMVFGNSTINNCDRGLVAHVMSNARIYDTTISNNSYGIQAQIAAEIAYQNSTVTFTNNTSGNTFTGDNGRITAC